MPKETKGVSHFGRGIISNVASTDIPDDACSFSTTSTGYITANLDPNVNGKLIGLPKSESKLSGSSNYNGRDFFGWIQKDDGTYTLVYNAGSAGSISRYIEDFYGTPGASTATGSYSVYSMVARNQELHCGSYSGTAAYWIGYVDKAQFGGSAPTSLVVTNQKLQHYQGSSSGNFDIYAGILNYGSSFDGSNQFYGYSLVYDGYQESPLYYVSDVNQLPTSAQSVEIKITAINAATSPSSFNDRISGIRIYRSTSSTRRYVDRGFFRLIKEIDIDDSVGVTETGTTTGTAANKLIQSGKGFTTSVVVGAYVLNTTDTTYAFVTNIDSDTQLSLSKDIMVSGENYQIYNGWQLSGNNYRFYHLDDGSVSGASYEAQTGIAETVEDTSIGYKLGAELNGYHFVADCVLPSDQITDGAHFLVRSQRERFNMFDWTKDFLRLPTVPTAMIGYSGRLFVWDSFRTYIINPEGLFIEDILDGAGCTDNTTLVSTDYGLFWADANRAFRFYNNDLRTISEPIEDQMGEVYTIDQVVFDAEQNFVMFYSGVNVWCFHVGKERWDYIGGIESAVTGAFTGKDGETYTCGGNKIVLNFKRGTVETGTTTSASSLKLIDSTQNFLTTVSAGMRVYNSTTHAVSTVSTVDSNTQLTLDQDIMTSGDAYIISYPTRAWYYSSPDFTMGEVGQDKRFYKLTLSSLGVVSALYSEDQNPTTTGIGADSKIDDAGGDWIQAKTLRIVFLGGRNSSVDNYEILFRRLIKL